MAFVSLLAHLALVRWPLWFGEGFVSLPFCFMCAGILPACMSKYPPGECLRQWPGESVRFPGTGVIDAS